MTWNLPKMALVLSSIVSFSSAYADETVLVLWSSPTLTGDKYTLTIPHADGKEASKTSDSAAIDTAKLKNRISSARLVCGDRKAQVSFSDSLHSFGNRITWTCEPHETKTIDFHKTYAKNGKSLADKVKWVNVQVHAPYHAQSEIGWSVKQYWDAEVKDYLPEDITSYKASETKWLNSKEFELRQYLAVDDYDCNESTVYAWYKVAFSTKADEYWGVHPQYKVASYDVYFSNWTCEYAHKDRIWDLLKAQAAYLEKQLNYLTKGAKATYYLTPSYKHDEVYVSWGNKPPQGEEDPY